MSEDESSDGGGTAVVGQQWGRGERKELKGLGVSGPAHCVAWGSPSLSISALSRYLLCA